MPLKRYKSVLNAVFLVAIFALTVWAVFDGENLEQLWLHMTEADPLWIVPAVVCVVLFIGFESVVIHLLLRTLGTAVRFSHCCLYSFIGFFYSCITPSASGGQPMQIIAMRKDRIPVVVSTVVLGIVTITYKLVLVVIGVAVMLLQPQPLMSYLEPARLLIWLGMFLNVVCIAVLLMLVFSPKLVRKLTRKVMDLFQKFRPFRHPERVEERMEHMISQYEGTADYFLNHKMLMVRVFLITLVQRMILFMVAWLTYLAFHLSGEGIVTVVLLQAMIAVAVDMLPLPGGMGISENLFLALFEPVFGAALVLPGMVICRGISYYTQLIVSAVMTLLSMFILRKKDP